jgi:hypothetical protein
MEKPEEPIVYLELKAHVNALDERLYQEGYRDGWENAMSEIVLRLNELNIKWMEA